MIHDASETLLNREEADRISSELANNVRGSSSSRKRKRVEGGLGGGLLAELSEDLDVEDERAKALVSALVRVSAVVWLLSGFGWMGGRGEAKEVETATTGGAWRATRFVLFNISIEIE